jgi:hypothetical protein
VVERGSDKHGQLVDEEMKREVEGLERGAPVEPRAEEFRQQEPAAEGQPEPDVRPEVTTDVELRADLARHLEPSRFPTDRDGLVEAATEQAAPDRILRMLAELPPGRTFRNVEEVWEAVGGRPDPPRG